MGRGDGLVAKEIPLVTSRLDRMVWLPRVLQWGFFSGVDWTILGWLISTWHWRLRASESSELTLADGQLAMLGSRHAGRHRHPHRGPDLGLLLLEVRSMSTRQRTASKQALLLAQAGGGRCEAV